MIDVLSPYSVECNGSVAYAAQEPFILNASVLDNITFGRPYDEELYRKVCCSLHGDACKERIM